MGLAPKPLSACLTTHGRPPDHLLSPAWDLTGAARCRGLPASRCHLTAAAHQRQIFANRTATVCAAT